MTLEITQYPVFEADQVLSQKHLNNMISYLEEQDRVSRTALLGMGIACGLEITRPKRTEIEVSCGTAITSLGFLITLEDTTYTHFKHATLSDKFLGPELEPDHYLNTIYEDVGIYAPYKECLELLPSGTKDPEGLALTEAIIEQRVVMLLLEVPLNDLKNCTQIDCEDKGKKLEFRVRALLIKKGDMEFNKFRLFPCGGYLKELRLQKLSSRSSLMVTGQQVLDSFNTKIRMAKPLLFKSNKDLYDLFESEFSEITGFNVLKDISNKINVIHRAHEDNIYIQYVWDWISDLVATYNEIVRFNSCHPMLCCPKANLFPFHVLLGLAEFDTKSSVLNPDRRKYRTSFIKTGALAASELVLRNELKGLLLKLIKQLRSFDLNEKIVKQEGIKITPSKLGDSPLSDRAIPFYYNKIEELNKFWSPTLTSKGLNTCILSYQSSVYNNTDDQVNLPILYDTEPYNFYRIEGHIGQPYDRALTSVISQVNLYRLPFKVVAFNASNYSKKMVDISKHKGDWNDLELDYDMARTKVFNITEHVINWIKFNKKLVIDNTIMHESDIANLSNILTQSRNLLSENLQEFLFEYEGFYTVFKRLNEIFAYQRQCVFLLGALGDGISDFLEDLVDHFDEINSLFLEDPFTVIVEEAHRRWEEQYKNLFLAKFLESHPGIDHKAGVPKGGTFILVYIDSSIFAKPKTRGFILENLLAQIDSYQTMFKFTETEKVEILRTNTPLIGRKIISKPSIVKKECSDELERVKGSILDNMKIDLGANVPHAVRDFMLDKMKGAFDRNLPDDVIVNRIPEKVVIADFYLPYICCSKGNNINIVLPPSDREETILADFEHKDFKDDDFFTNKPQ